MFAGATAISSDAYFGRAEDPTSAGPYGGRDPMDMTTAELMSTLSMHARADLDRAKQVAGVAAKKLIGFVQNFTR